MSIRLAIALMFFQAPVSPAKDFAPIEVRSADGSCLARIDRAAGQEGVAANMARFTLRVFALDPGDRRREIWDSPYPYDPSPARYILANRGRVFVEVRTRFSESHTVLQVREPGRELAKWSGAELSIPRDVLGGTDLDRSWLDESREPSIGWTDGPFGPRLELEIPCRGNLVRKLDLERAQLIDAAGIPIEPRVEPAIEGSLPARVGVPYVQTVEFRRCARAGREIEVQIQGNHATPGWRFLGFELETGDGRLVLTPRSEAPEGIVPQVLTAFRASARLIDLPTGRYKLEVSGWNSSGDPSTIDVLPASLIARLETRGGFAGIRQQLEIHQQSIARRSFGDGARHEFIELSDERMERLRQLIAALPVENRRASTAGAADLFEHSLGFWSNESWITIEVDDLAATAAERELIAALRE